MKKELVHRYLIEEYRAEIDGRKVLLFEVQDMSEHSCGAFDTVSMWAYCKPMRKGAITEMAFDEAEVRECAEGGATVIYHFKEKAPTDHAPQDETLLLVESVTPSIPREINPDAMARLKQTAEKWGLVDKDDILWISEWREETLYHAPREMVKDMKLLSELCIHPSTSETYSLVVQESMLAKNFCLLNHHFPAMRDIYGSRNVLYEPFGGAVNALDMDNGSTNLHISNEQTHFDNLANKVRYFLENDWAVAQFRFVRKFRNTDYIFKHELEPLLYFKGVDKPYKIL
jgi:hypothetical protein